MRNIKKPETVKEKSETVCTKLKFVKSDKTGSYIGFVSQKQKSHTYFGVRQDCPYPKKVCVLDKKLTCEILTNVLYDVELVPMRERNGFIVVSAVPCEFAATIETLYTPKIQYRINVKFGNKCITYDPLDGEKDSVKKLSACRAILEKRVDIKDLSQVLNDFDKAASDLLNQMFADGLARKLCH